MSQSKTFKAWLEKIQQESWQLELIISGFALFGIKEGISIIKKLELTTNFEAGDITFFYMSGLGSARVVLIILFINLLIHVIFRSLWIGAIGLRYVSGDIDYSRLNYAQIFNSFLKKRNSSFDNYISKLEDWCSVLFAYAFLLTFMIFSFFIFLFWPILLITFEFDPGSAGQIVIFITVFFYFIFGIIFFLDLLLLGLFKKVKNRFFSNLFYAIFRVYDLITLSFLYRPLLLNFLDSKFTRKLYFFALPFLIVILIYPRFQIFDFRHLDSFSEQNYLRNNYYDDLREENESRSIFGLERKQKIFWISLSNHIIEKDYSKVFFTLRQADSDFLEKKNSIKTQVKSGLRIKNKFLQRNVKNRSFSLSVNDTLTTDLLLELIDFKIDGINYVDSLSCKIYKHQNLNEEGMICIYPVNELKQGEHIIEIERRIYSESTQDSFIRRNYELPIWVFKNKSLN